MIRNQILSPIASIKNRIVNFLITFYALIGIPLLLIAYSRFASTGMYIAFIIEAFLVFIIFLLMIFRKRVSFIFKAVFLSVVLLGLGVVSLFFQGMFSSGILFLILFIVFSTLFLGRKYGYLALAFVFLIMLSNGLLNALGIYEFPLEKIILLTQMDQLITKGIILLVASYSIVLIITRFEHANTSLLEQSENSESGYRLLFEQSSEGIVILDKKGHIELVNEKFREISGYNNEAIKGLFFSKLLDGDFADRSTKLDLIKEGKVLDLELAIITNDGKKRQVAIRASRLPDSRYHALIRDVGEQQKYEKVIEEERQFGQALIETMPGIFYVFENYDKLVRWNDSLKYISGYSSEELAQIHPNTLFKTGEYDSVQNNMLGSQQEQSAYFRADLVTKDGKNISLYNSAIQYEREGKIYLMGMGYDISELLSAQKALKNSEENFRNIYNNTSDAVFIFDYNLKVLSANETFFALTGLSPEDLDTLNIFDFIFDQNALEKVAREVTKLGNSRVVVAEYNVRDVYGRRFPIEVRSRKITYEGHPAIVTAFNDISERKNLEKQVYTVSVKAEEDERGRIAKDLHDGLGPLLSTCKIYLHSIKNAEYSEKESRSYNKLSELINESLTGVKEISNNLSPHVLRNFGLVHALKSFIDKYSAYNEIEIEQNFKTIRRYNEIIEITLYRIATELLNNTLKHSGATKIEIGLLEKAQKLHFFYADNGVGFNYEHVLEHKSGLGLLNIKSRINSIGGFINFTTQTGEGVNVKIETSI